MFAPRTALIRFVVVAFAAAILAVLAPVQSACGQGGCPPVWFPGQDVPGVHGGVRALAVLPSGDVIAGGQFSSAGGVAASCIARYSPGARTWSSLGAGTNGPVEALAVLPGGDVVAGGRFTQAGGVAARNIARYSPASNTWSALGAGVVGTADFSGVQALMVTLGGDVFVGGRFTSAGGVAANNIAIYNLATGIWSPIGSGVTTTVPAGSDSVVNALVALPGGDLILAGSFSSGGGVAVNNIARYSPASNTWSSLGLGVLPAAGSGPSIYALAVIQGGDVIVGGYFISAGGVAANYVARYNPNTNVWTTVGSGTNGTVLAFAVLPGGDVIVGGYFTSAGGLAVSNMARYRPLSNTWFDLGTTGTNDYPSAMAVLSGGDVIVGGEYFTQAGAVTANSIARYSPATSTWSTLGPGMNGRIQASVVLPNGDVIVGGVFTNVGGVAANRVARYSPASNTWSSLGAGTNGPVFTLAVLPGGDVIVGGQFSSAGGVSVSSLARYRPSSNTWSALGSETNGSVYALTVLPGGDVIVGGFFTPSGGGGARGIARLNPVTNTWSALGSGIPGGTVSALAVLPGGDVVVGGSFLAAGGVAAKNIARISPATNSWSALGAGVNLPYAFATTFAIAVLPGGDLIVGSLFDSAGGVVANNIARYNPTTNTWSALGSGVTGPASSLSSVSALVVLPGGDVMVGGQFASAGGTSASNVARYSPASNTWSAIGAGTDNAVYSLSVLPSGSLVLGGRFIEAGGGTSAFFARYTFFIPAPSIITQPTSATACPTGLAVFEVQASGGDSYQWQVQTSSGVWTNLASDPGPIACSGGGTGTAFATPSNSPVVSIGLRGCAGAPGRVRPIRCIISSPCGTITSGTATLTIAPRCSVADLMGTDNSSPGATVTCGDGIVDGSDFVAFINSFAIGDVSIDPLADVAGGGTGSVPDPDGTIDGTDFVAFINAFALGC